MITPAPPPPAAKGCPWRSRAALRIFSTSVRASLMRRAAFSRASRIIVAACSRLASATARASATICSASWRAAATDSWATLVCSSKSPARRRAAPTISAAVCFAAAISEASIDARQATGTLNWPTSKSCHTCSGIGPGGGEAGPVSDGGRLHATGDAEFGQDVRDVHAGGLRADEQGLGDFPVGVPGGDQQQDLALAAGETEPGELVFLPRRGAGCEADPRAPGKRGGVGSDRRGAQPFGDRVGLAQGAGCLVAVASGKACLGEAQQRVAELVRVADGPPGVRGGGPGAAVRWPDGPRVLGCRQRPVRQQDRKLRRGGHVRCYPGQLG